MASRSNHPRHQLVELLEGRPGWRLEPRTTPGASPLWCFVYEGQIEYSVTVEDDLVRLYVMADDQELQFPDADALTEWLRTHRADALQPAPARPDGKKRLKRLFEWS
jgi:hypothetical protein